MSSPAFVFAEWRPYRLVLRPPVAPGGGTWKQLDDYARHLASLKMADPTKASAHRALAEAVRDEAERYSASAARPKATERKVRTEMEATVQALLHLAVIAIHQHDWMHELQPLAMKAVEKRDPQLWSRVHGFAEWLRDPMVGVCALSAAMANATQDADSWLYMAADAGRGVFYWQVEHAPGLAVPSMTVALPGGGFLVGYTFKGTPPVPPVRDFAENIEAWGGAGLYAAEQVIAGQARSLAEQDREVDALMAEQMPKTQRRAVTPWANPRLHAPDLA